MTLRVIPDSVRRELDRQDSSEVMLVFLTVTHAELAAPIRVVSDPRNFILDNNEYIGFEFDIRILNDTENPPFSQLTIQNVDKKISEGILTARNPARINIEVIAGSEFNLDDNPCTEKDGVGSAQRTYKAPHLFLTEVEGNALSISGRIVSWDYTQELWPGLLATQDRLPGLFR